MNRRERRAQAATRQKVVRPFREVVTALAMAGPWCSLPTFGTLARCIQMSVAGSEVLRRRGYKAAPAPCAIRVNHGDGVVYMGDRSACYEIEKRCSSNPPPLDEWDARAENASPDVDPNQRVHMVIEAHHEGTRALVDLTLGQIYERTDGEVQVPNVLLAFCKGWPDQPIKGVRVTYGPARAPEPGQIDPPLLVPIPRLVTDLETVMLAASYCGLDPSEFTAEMSRQAAQHEMSLN